MAAVKILKRKQEETNYLPEILQMTGLEQLEKNFPDQTMEPWRRLDPKSLLSLLHESLKNGWEPLPLSWKTGRPDDPATTSDPRASQYLKTLAEWKKEDEVFFHKVTELLSGEKFAWPKEKSFFSDFAGKLCPPGHLAVLRIPRNTHWENPIHLIWKTKQTLQYLLVDRLFIFAEENSSATIYTEKFSEGFGISIQNIYQAANSELKIHHLQREGIGANKNKHSAWVAHQKFYLEKDARNNQGVYSAGGKIGKFFSEVHLEKGSSIDSYGLHVGNHSHVDHDFLVHHAGPSSRSSLLFKTALADEAYGIFWGNLLIPQQSPGCQAVQQNKNLIIGENSRADAIPQLEILTEQVEASHGSATGELDEEEYFYLMSRGLDENHTRQLLLMGFFEDILQQALGHTQDQSGFKNPYLHDIWCAIQDRLKMNFERSFMGE